MISFTWDPHKNDLNQLKHGISFEEAATVFLDDNAILFDDPAHSFDEERFLIIGITRAEHLCVVSHCYSDNESIIRIISARKANRTETSTYNKYAGGLLL